MAPLLTNTRGSAVLEAGAAALVLFVFTSGVMIAGYALFARVWLQYQSEQALYCLGEKRPEWLCRREFTEKIRSALPWGRLTRADLSVWNDVWVVEAQWQLQGAHLNVRKRLSIAAIVQTRDLRW